MRIPRLLRRAVSRETEPPGHPGIRLRISNLNGELVDADSDTLYLSAKYTAIDQCGPFCTPGCDQHGWLELIPGADHPFQYAHDLPHPARLRIEIKAVQL